MTAADVLAATADRIEARPSHVNEREFRNSAGPAVYSALFETSRQIFGWTAVEVMQKHLRIQQLQHWDTTDVAAIVAELRAAAKAPADPLGEVTAIRARLAGFQSLLAESLGWGPWAASSSPESLVSEVVKRIDRLEAQVTRLEAQLTEARKTAAASR